MEFLSKYWLLIIAILIGVGLGLLYKRFYGKPNDKFTGASVTHEFLKQEVQPEASKEQVEDIPQEPEVLNISEEMLQVGIRSLRLKTLKEIGEEMKHLAEGDLRNLEQPWMLGKSMYIHLIYAEDNRFKNIAPFIVEVAEGNIPADSPKYRLAQTLVTLFQERYQTLAQEYPNRLCEAASFLTEVNHFNRKQPESWAVLSFRDFLSNYGVKTELVPSKKDLTHHYTADQRYDFGVPSEAKRSILTDISFGPIDARALTMNELPTGGITNDSTVCRIDFAEGGYQVSGLKLFNNKVDVYLKMQFDIEPRELELRRALSKFTATLWGRFEKSTTDDVLSEGYSLDGGERVIDYYRPIAMKVITQEVLDAIGKFITPKTQISVYRSAGFLNVELRDENKVLLLSDRGAYITDANPQPPRNNMLVDELVRLIDPVPDTSKRYELDFNLGETSVTWFLNSNKPEHTVKEMTNE